MLPKINRLVEKKDFLSVRRLGTKNDSPIFLVTAHFYNQEFPSKFGFIVTNRFSKKAIERNRTKRLMREAVSQFLPKMKKGYGVVFLAKPFLLDKSFKVVLSETEKILQKAELLETDEKNLS